MFPVESTTDLWVVELISEIILHRSRKIIVNKRDMTEKHIL